MIHALLATSINIEKVKYKIHLGLQMTPDFEYLNNLLYKSDIGFTIGRNNGLITIDLEDNEHREISITIINVDIKNNILQFKLNGCEKIEHSSQFIQSISTELECQTI